MSLKITSVTRVSPAPCQHFEVTADNNGTIRSKVFSREELDAILDQFSDFPGGARGALLLAWIVDRRKRGATLAQLTDIEIESVI